MYSQTEFHITTTSKYSQRDQNRIFNFLIAWCPSKEREARSQQDKTNASTRGFRWEPLGDKWLGETTQDNNSVDGK
jgi:hypothetical protein